LILFGVVKVMLLFARHLGHFIMPNHAAIRCGLSPVSQRG